MVLVGMYIAKVIAPGWEGPCCSCPIARADAWANSQPAEPSRLGKCQREKTKKRSSSRAGPRCHRSLFFGYRVPAWAIQCCLTGSRLAQRQAASFGTTQAYILGEEVNQ